MSDGFTIGAAMGEPTIFECPNCKETIDATAEACRFCGVKVDREAARKAATLMAKVNQACSDSSYMKSTALTLPVFFILRFVPFISAVGGIGFWVLLIAIPLWALRWLLKYRGIETDDAEFLKARSTVKWIGIIVAAVFAGFLAVNILMLLLARPS
ncbi:MAG: hypothetical protein ACLPLZ_09370 [Terracidiphilus sp.]